MGHYMNTGLSSKTRVRHRGHPSSSSSLALRAQSLHTTWWQGVSCLERSGALHAAQQSPPTLAALCACDKGDSSGFPADPPSFPSLPVNWLKPADSRSVARGRAFEEDQVRNKLVLFGMGVNKHLVEGGCWYNRVPA